MKVQWTSDLATGSSEIDSQHVELFKRIDSLLTAFGKGVVNAKDVEETIRFLGDYVIHHFDAEETFMTKYGYGNRAAHVAQHEQFVKNFGKIRERIYKEGVGPEVAGDTKQLCVDWLVNHIKFSDKALGLFLQKKIR